MKFFIVLTIFCFSTISAAPTEEPSPLAAAAAEYARKLVNEWEQKIPGWDSKATLYSNLLALLSKPFDNNLVPAWNPDVSAKENFEKYIALLDVEGLDGSKSVVYNLALIIGKYFDKLPIPMFFPKNEMEKKVVDKIVDYIVENHIDEQINSETLDQGLKAWFNDHDDVLVSDPKELIRDTLDEFYPILYFVGFQGQTLEDLIVQITEFIFKE